MKFCFIITGLLRNYHKGLYLYLKELKKYLDFDVYIYTSSTSLDSQYSIFSSDTLFPEMISWNKLFICDNTELKIESIYTQREKNIFYQWYKLQKCFTFIPNIYNFYVRLRPDINLLLSPDSFATILNSCQPSILYIPTLPQLIDGRLNDEIAIGSYEILQKYSDFYTYLKGDLFERPLVSSELLFRHIRAQSICIEHINIPYTISLSDCFVLAICGDSSSGKTTILNAIQNVFPFDSRLVLETDRYHKWERSSKNWKNYTHLNPEANHLEKLIDDSFQLKIGNSIHAIDYDHKTGKFTAPESLEPKANLVLCGLHTLYKERLREQIDIKIYVETAENLKTFWKVKRDTVKRGYSLEHILEQINARKSDFLQFIEPQKEHANVVFYYSYNGLIHFDQKEIDESLLEFHIKLDNSLICFAHKLLYDFSESQRPIDGTTTLFKIKKNIKNSQLLEFILTNKIFLENDKLLVDSYLGFIQLFVLRLLHV